MKETHLTYLIEQAVTSFLYGNKPIPDMDSQTLITVFAKDFPNEYQNIVKQCQNKFGEMKRKGDILLKKYRYVFQKDKEFDYLFISLDDWEDYGTMMNFRRLIRMKEKRGFKLISRDVQTDLEDKNETAIYHNDIIAFDKHVWYRGSFLTEKEYEQLNDHFILIDWDTSKAGWGGTNKRDIREYCHIIGNSHELGEPKHKYVEREEGRHPICTTYLLP